MQIQETALKGVLILIFDGKTDARGTMNVTIDTSALADAGISFACKEQRLYHMPKKEPSLAFTFRRSAIRRISSSICRRDAAWIT